jgi:hypothetical protein
VEPVKREPGLKMFKFPHVKYECCRYREDGKTYSFNSLFISMRSQQQNRIPLRMAILNLVHELMHAFGKKASFLRQMLSRTMTRC